MSSLGALLTLCGGGNMLVGERGWRDARATEWHNYVSEMETNDSGKNSKVDWIALH